jgi:hypothetical protein
MSDPPELHPSRPHERVTTQNLLVSSTVFEREKTEKGITVQCLTDLSTLIDLYCLYDRIIVLGRGVPLPPHTRESELLHSLKDDGVIDEQKVTPDIAPSVGQAAARHLATCLNKKPSERLTRILEDTVNPRWVFYGLPETLDSLADTIL